MLELLNGLPSWVMYAGMATVLGLFVLMFVLIIVAKFYRKVDQGSALIVNTTKQEPTVTFTGAVVLPIIHRSEIMDISVKTIEIDRRQKEGLICADNIRADIKVTFFVRVNKTGEDVLKVAQSIGCARASDPETLERLFVAKFSEALKTVGKRMEFEELYTKRDEFRDEIIKIIGKDLNGYVLDDCAIDYLEQTPLEVLDKDNILDAQGIRKITMITAEQHVHTNSLKQKELMDITKQNVAAAEAILEMEKQRADAESRQKREIATIQARETAETLRVQAEERQKAEVARLKSEEEIGITEENKQRQISIALKNRERVVAVETERVEKDRQLEAINRERETELQRIEKEKALEQERKVIADSIAVRISVEKQVAQEEERIKDLRVVAEAQRKKNATIIQAEASAESAVIAQVKKAEADEQAARFKAKETIVAADADLEAADRIARSKIRVAEGTQAEEAAAGLAKVKVKEADAVATERFGLAEARVLLEKKQADAKGREAESVAVAKLGAAEADARRQLLLAEASGEQEKGMAHVRVREADASAIEKQGMAEAVKIREKLNAEAEGLLGKADALKKFDGEARAHEEFRIRLERDTDVALATIKAKTDIASSQADVMGKAMSTAKINIVGGDGQFLERFFKAVSLGQSVDGAVDQSEILKKSFAGYLSGDASLREDIKDVLTRPSVDSESLKNLSVVAVLNQFMQSSDENKRKLLKGLVDRAREVGLE